MSMRLTRGLTGNSLRPPPFRSNVRFANDSAGVVRFRPLLRLTPVAVRRQSNTPWVPPSQDPKAKAQSLLDSLPGNSLVSKTAILSSIAGLSVAAISSELYVVNEETLVAISLVCAFAIVGKMAGPAYTDWASEQVAKIKGILDAARQDHTRAVRDRIESVSQMGGVVDITKSLFEVSKETARLEAKAFELEQRTAFVAEAKQVLDSWVRYESQVKQRQQKELAQTLIAKVKKELENPKTLNEILKNSVAEVESMFCP